MDTPKNFFLQIGIIATLYASIISFLSFLFSLINNVFPNPEAYYYDITNSSMRYSISVLIVVFPIFLFLSRLHRRTIEVNVELKHSKLRKWLLYLTLFLAGVAVAVDVIVLINTFLGGEDLPTSFILKVLSVFVVAGSVFFFYLKDIKGAWDLNPKGAKIAAIVTTVVVLVAVVGGIVTIGSPSKQRDLISDQNKVNDLSGVQYQIIEYYQDKGTLPKTLKEVVDPLRGNVLPKNIDTGGDYVYEVTGPLSFKLCADFKTVSKVENPQTVKESIAYYPMQENEHWAHQIGTTCFDRTIDPERFPQRKSI